LAPTVFSVRKYRIVVYPKDHDPPHVHIVGPDAYAKFDIETLDCIVCQGFTLKTLNRFRKLLHERKQTLLEAWNENVQKED
jgi:hypothetical protein